MSGHGAKSLIGDLTKALPNRIREILGEERSTKWTIASFIGGLVAFELLNLFLRNQAKTASTRENDADSTDPPLLKRSSTYQSYTTSSGYTYPRIRTFYSPHPHASKLPSDLPLLVFVHGLGGSIAQFAPLLTSLTNVAPCLAIDLPGCGRSELGPKWAAEAYTPAALAELVWVAVLRVLTMDGERKVVFVAHSLGCSISALLVSSSSPMGGLGRDDVVGLVAVCPRSREFGEKELKDLARLGWLPTPVFDALRWLDRRGGLESRSVRRVVGEHADEETKRLQMRFNEQSRSATFQKFCAGIRLLETRTRSLGKESLFGRRTWGGIKVPLFLIAAEDDHLTSPNNADQIAAWLTEGRKSSKATVNEEHVAPNEQGHRDEAIVPATSGDAVVAQEQLASYTGLSIPPDAVDEASGATLHETTTSSTNHSFALKTTLFPSPASHSLLYSPMAVRILSGLIESFLAAHVDSRLSPAWQLQHLSTSGKWDVKNLAKWRKIDPVSPVLGGVFRAMKTMREVDDVHCPKGFVEDFAVKDGYKVVYVVDISHETPVYDPKGLDEGSVTYVKFPTVSKLPPTNEEVERFIKLIDELRWSDKMSIQESDDGLKSVIAVHCHYGFNRTGFLLICYMVEKLGYRLQDAVEEFAEKRPPGIKHEYFINELFVRYAVKMERRGTVIG